MSIVAQAVHLAEPWAEFYSNARWLQVTTVFAHVSGFFIGGGFAVAADRATMAAARAAVWARRKRQLVHLRRTHVVVLGGLLLTFVSGALMFAADVENLVSSWAFWAKMTAVALLIVNGAVLSRTEQRIRAANGEDASGWRRLRVVSACSLVLWLATILGGTLITNTG